MPLKNAALTIKQQRFADEYIKTGNARESYMKVYSCKERVADANSSRMLSNAKLTDYIEQVNISLKRSTIADMAEVKEFWTNTLRSEENDYKDRLKASEYIAKSNAAFIEKVEHSGKIEMPAIVIKK